MLKHSAVVHGKQETFSRKHLYMTTAILKQYPAQGCFDQLSKRMRALGDGRVHHMVHATILFLGAEMAEISEDHFDPPPPTTHHHLPHFPEHVIAGFGTFPSSAWWAHEVSPNRKQMS